MTRSIIDEQDSLCWDNSLSNSVKNSHYVKPQMTVHGSVTELTKGSGGTILDGTNTFSKLGNA